MTKWIDISQPLTNVIAHWPGDVPFHYETTVTKEDSGSVNIGKIVMSTHTGTHIDAPFHFLNEGKRILDLDMERYIGPCKVIEIGNAVEINQSTLKACITDATERLLIKTALPNIPERFPEAIQPITPDGAAYLASIGVKLVGVDTPSVDPVTSKKLEGHHALYKHDIFILENVMLDDVEAGDYELIALPLALAEADGSPVRAVIKRIEDKGDMCK